MHDILPPKMGRTIRINPLPFDDQITVAMWSSTAIAASDASMKHNQMGGHRIITNKEKITEMKNTLHHKNWNDNTNIRVEAMVLLELIEAIERKGR